MSRTELHNWECAIESLCGDNADKILAIAQDIYNTAYIQGKNYMSLEQPRWIPVSERLPKENGVYIISYEDSVKLLEWFNEKWFFYPSNPSREETGTITAWMPLPKPYKESEDK